MPDRNATAEVDTDKPVPYMRQLCKHFGHKHDVEYGDTTGSIRFEYGACELEAGDGILGLVVTAGDEESLERMERVIGGHLERFGARDELSVSWTRPA
jgi:hypothetical protein